MQEYETYELHFLVDGTDEPLMTLDFTRGVPVPQVGETVAVAREPRTEFGTGRVLDSGLAEREYTVARRRFTFSSSAGFPSCRVALFVVPSDGEA